METPQLENSTSAANNNSPTPGTSSTPSSTPSTPSPSSPKTPTAATGPTQSTNLRDQLKQAMEKDTNASKDTAATPIEQPSKQDAKTEDTKVVDKPAFEPIQSWPEDVKAKFAQLPPDQQEFLVGREKDLQRDYHKKTQEIAPLRKAMTPFKSMLDNVQNSYGYAPDVVIGNTLATFQKLLYGTPEQKAQEWMNVAQQYGVPLNGIQGQDQFEDPSVQALKNEIAQLKSQVFQSQNQALTRNEFQSIQASQQTMSEIDNFVAMKTETGQAAYPFASRSDVLEEMAILANGYSSQGREVPPLPQLYERAVYSMPNLRQELVKQTVDRENKVFLENLKKENQERAVKAQNASSSITNGSLVPGGSMAPKGSLREQLEAAYASSAGSGNRI